MKFHTSAASGLKSGQSDRKRNLMFHIRFGVLSSGVLDFWFWIDSIADWGLQILDVLIWDFRYRISDWKKPLRAGINPISAKLFLYKRSKKNEHRTSNVQHRMWNGKKGRSKHIILKTGCLRNPIFNCSLLHFSRSRVDEQIKFSSLSVTSIKTTEKQ